MASTHGKIRSTVRGPHTPKVVKSLKSPSNPASPTEPTPKCCLPAKALGPAPSHNDGHGALLREAALRAAIQPGTAMGDIHIYICVCVYVYIYIHIGEQNGNYYLGFRERS